MRLQTALAAAAVALTVGGSMTAPASAASSADLERNKQVALSFYKGMQEQNVDVAASYLTDGYIQHNPNVATGKAGFVNFFGPRWKPRPSGPTMPNPPALVMAEDDLVTLMFRRPTPEPSDPGKTYDAWWFDIFRIKDGKITEHWDGATKPVQPAAR